MQEQAVSPAPVRRAGQPPSLQARRRQPQPAAAALAERREPPTSAGPEVWGRPVATEATETRQPRRQRVAPAVRLRLRPAAVVRAVRPLRPAIVAARAERERRRQQPVRPPEP